MPRFLGICDPHLSGTNPAAWKASYEAFNTDVLLQAWEYGREKRIDAVLVAGDLFHRKGEANLGFLLRTARLWKEAPAPVYAIAGNHDMRSGAYRAEDATAFAVMEAMGAIKNLAGAAVAWDGVKIDGAHYDHGSAGTFLDLRGGEDWNIHLGHFAFGPKSSEMFGQKVYGPEDLAGGVHSVALIGHHHYHQGRHVHGSKTYLAPGSSTWTSRHQADHDRRPAMVLIEVEGCALSTEFFYPEVGSFSNMIDLDKHRQVQEENEQLEAMVAQLRTEFAGVDPLEALKDLACGPAVRARVQTYLEEAEAE